LRDDAAVAAGAIGNAAPGRLQLDVFGDVVEALHHVVGNRAPAFPPSRWPARRTT